MINKELEDLTRYEFSKVSSYLLNNFGIKTKEKKHMDYGIKFEGINKENKVCNFIVYCNKKGKMRIVIEKTQDENLSEKIKEVFSNKDNLAVVNEERVNNESKSSSELFRNGKPKKIEDQSKENTFLDDVYIRLKPYEYEDMEFRIFAEELLKNIHDESDRKSVLNNINNFKFLESIYIKLKK